MNKIAIIPARGGSKRIPRKNIKPFFGQPIIVYSIETAIRSGIFEEIMVSTDDPEIAKISTEAGAKVPIFRSKENSDDYADLSEVIEEVLTFYKTNNQHFSFFCCILPTTPFLKPYRIKQGFNLLLTGQYDSVFPVIKYGHPIQRALEIVDKKVKMLCPENLRKRTQDLPLTYYDCGQFYWMRINEFLKQKKLFTANSGTIEIPGTEVQDIDNEEDWKKAELYFQILNHTQNSSGK